MSIAIRIITAAAAISAAMASFAQTPPSDKGFVIVTDYITADGRTDVSGAIQQIIDDNPNRTIYFPDGVYLISRPILTPAEPTKSVALELSNYAVIKAVPEWSHDEAMIRLGGKDPANNITTPGSNYYLSGGVIDGSGVAKGISIDSGRETVIRDTSIKDVTTGIHIKHGANSGSSDSDIHDVNITGNNRPGSVGVLVESCDNTFTNMRIGGVYTGFRIRGQANSLRNIHPLYYGASDESYVSTCGFADEGGNNWYDFCYSDEFATGFICTGRSLYDNCYVYWYSKRGTKHTAFRAPGRFESDIINPNVGHFGHNATKENVVLEVGEAGGRGKIINPYVRDPHVVTDNTHVEYLKE